MPDDLRQILGVKKPGESDFVNFLIYGEPKVGKTLFTATATEHPETSPVLLLDAEGGTTTIRKYKQIDVVEVRTIEELNKKILDLQKAGEDLRNYYKTVVIDNMTEVQELDLKVIMRQAYQKNPDKVDIDVPSPREWKKTGEHMRAIARAVRDLPCNTILTAHVVEVERDGQPTRKYPGFGGQAKTAVAGYMDIVGWMQIIQDRGKEAYTQIQFKGTRSTLAGDRFDLLEDTIKNPTFPQLWEAIKGSGTGE